MIRCSKHNISSLTNRGKISFLDLLFADYKHDLEIYISYILDGMLPLKVNISSALLPTEVIQHSKYKREIYKQASSIIRSQLDKAKKNGLPDTNKYILIFLKAEDKQILLERSFRS